MEGSSCAKNQLDSFIRFDRTLTSDTDIGAWHSLYRGRAVFLHTGCYKNKEDMVKERLIVLLTTTIGYECFVFDSAL